MAATRTSRRSTRRPTTRTTRARKTTPRHAVSSVSKTAVKAAGKTVAAAVAKPVGKPVVKLGSKLGPAPQVLFRFCKPGWTVIVDKISNAQGTRFVCPFCTVSHRVPGPVRGFRKMRRAQWIKQRRVEE